MYVLMRIIQLKVMKNDNKKNEWQNLDMVSEQKGDVVHKHKNSGSMDHSLPTTASENSYTGTDVASGIMYQWVLSKILYFIFSDK